MWIDHAVGSESCRALHEAALDSDRQHFRYLQAASLSTFAMALLYSPILAYFAPLYVHLIVVFDI